MAEGEALFVRERAAVREPEGLPVGERVNDGDDDAQAVREELGVAVTAEEAEADGDSVSRIGVPDDEKLADDDARGLMDADGEEDGEGVPVLDLKAVRDAEAQAVIVVDRIPVCVGEADSDERVERVAQLEGDLDAMLVRVGLEDEVLETLVVTDNLAEAVCVRETSGDADREPDDEALSLSETHADALAEGESEELRDSMGEREVEADMEGERERPLEGETAGVRLLLAVTEVVLVAIRENDTV